MVRYLVYHTHPCSALCLLLVEMNSVLPALHGSIETVQPARDLGWQRVKLSQKWILSLENSQMQTLQSNPRWQNWTKIIRQLEVTSFSRFPHYLARKIHPSLRRHKTFAVFITSLCSVSVLSHCGMVHFYTALVFSLRLSNCPLSIVTSLEDPPVRAAEMGESHSQPLPVSFVYPTWAFPMLK